MPNPFVHVELATDNVGEAKRFYSALFKWKLTDNQMGPDMVYTMIDVGTGTGGGMMKKPMPQAPTQWLTYVEVDDVGKTIAKARDLGATIVVENQPIPNMGAFGIFVDPTGAALGVWQPAARPAAVAASKPAARKPAAKPKPKAKAKAKAKAKPKAKSRGRK